MAKERDSAIIQMKPESTTNYLEDETKYGLNMESSDSRVQKIKLNDWQGKQNTQVQDSIIMTEGDKKRYVAYKDAWWFHVE